MLPQFGFIVAQAGADSQPNNNNSNNTTSSNNTMNGMSSQHQNPTATTTSSSSTTNTTSAPSNIQQTNKRYSTHPNEQPPYPYYTRHPSPPSSSTPMLPPPPLPYMYTTQPPPLQQQPREEYYNKGYYQQVPPPSQQQHSDLNRHDNHTHHTSYRPLQPLPPPPSQSNTSWHAPNDGGYTMVDPYHHQPGWHQQPPQPYHHPNISLPPPPPIHHPPAPIINNAPTVQPYNNNANSNMSSNSAANIPTTTSTTTTTNKNQNGMVAQTTGDDYVYDDSAYPAQQHSSYGRWQEEPIEISENKMLRRIREFNDLMTWMDSEFWEQCDEIYREKLQSLQEEIRTIQQGTHSAFKETMTDIELRREQTIEYAEYYKNYELLLSKHQYDQEKSILQDEYENERHNLHDMVLQAIEDRRKQIKEDKEDTEFDVQDLFRDAYSRVNNKRSLRKRTQFDRHSSASPSRQERRRQNRQSTPHNIHTAPSTMEEEELESEFINMKGGLPPRRQQGTSSSQTRR